MLMRALAHVLCRSLELAIGLSALRAALFLGGIW
jgi:hypothetical protein